MLNMNDFRSYDVFNREVLYLIHFTYVVFVIILLINLLIAVFSNSMARVNENKEVTTLCSGQSGLLSKILQYLYIYFSLV